MAINSTPAIVDQQGSVLLNIARLSEPSNSTEGIQLSELKQNSTSEVQRFGADLASHLASEADLRVPPAFQLQSAEQGKVQVVGDHPNKTAIEDYLNNNSRLLKWFKELEVLFEIQRRIELGEQADDLANQVFNFGLTSLGGIAFFTRK